MKSTIRFLVESGFHQKRASPPRKGRSSYSGPASESGPESETYQRYCYLCDRRNINYTNICCCSCRFCAFYRSPHHQEGYLLTKEEIFQKIEELLAVGGTQVLMQGGLHPGLTLEYIENLFSEIKKRYPVTLHCLSPVEIDYLARKGGLPLEQVIKRLQKAGLDSLPGGGAEILVERVRQEISPNKTSAQRWLEVTAAVHRSGIKSTATMVFGHRETLHDRILHLEAVRSLQDKTGDSLPLSLDIPT